MGEQQVCRIFTVNQKGNLLANQQKDYLHKLSAEITNQYELVSVENLNLRRMSQRLRLGKSTLNNGYGGFCSILK